MTAEEAVVKDTRVAPPVLANSSCEEFDKSHIEAILGVLLPAYEAELSPHEATENTPAPSLSEKTKKT